MKKIFGSIIFTVSVGFVFSQQEPQFSQYLRNQYMVNPGAAGVYNLTDVTVSGRLQWLGFTNAPVTSYVSVSAPLSKKPRERYNPSLRISSGPIRTPEVVIGKLKHAIGGQLMSDQYGAFRKINFSGTYAIHMPISKKYYLSFGTRIGISNNSFLQDRAIVLNPASDPSYSAYILNQSNKNILSIGTGLYLYSKNQNVFFGISADQLTRGLISFGPGTANFDPKIHANITGGVKIPAGSDLTITPAFLVKYMSPAPPTIEATVQAEYMQSYWMGVSYRHTDALVVMAGLNISKRFKFGYSFDYSISKFNIYAVGSHELVLGIML